MVTCHRHPMISHCYRYLIVTVSVTGNEVSDSNCCYRYLFERLDGRIRGNMRQEAIDRFSKPGKYHLLSGSPSQVNIPLCLVLQVR